MCRVQIDENYFIRIRFGSMNFIFGQVEFQSDFEYYFMVQIGYSQLMQETTTVSISIHHTLGVIFQRRWEVAHCVTGDGGNVS